jgi:hypothetical protein
MACPAPVIDVPLQSVPGRLFTVSRLGLETLRASYSPTPRQAAQKLLRSFRWPRFLTRRQSNGSTAIGTDLEVATSTKPP